MTQNGHWPSSAARRPCGPERKLVGVRELLVAYPDFTDYIEIRLVGLKHEKLQADTAELHLASLKSGQFCTDD